MRRIIIIVIFLIVAITSLFIGAVDIKIIDILTFEKEAWFFLLNSRIPRTGVIIISAASLSIAGLIMQSLGRNKFISPSTTGTTSFAALGVFVSIVLFGGSSSLLRMIFAFIFAMVGTMFFMFLLRKIKFNNTIYIPLIGILYGTVVTAFTIFIAQQLNLMQLLTSINVGTYLNTSTADLKVILVIVVPLILSIIFASAFNVISMGESFTKNLGLNYNVIMIIGLLIVSIIAAVNFVVVGPIPFLGLIVPNLVSKFYGDNIKKSLFDVAIFGALFVLVSDIIARTVVFPLEIPVNVVMGVVGAIIFLILLLKGEKHVKE